MEPPDRPADHAAHHIAGGVRGWLESPEPDAGVDGCLLITGWAFSTGPPIVAIRADIAGRRWPLRVRLRRDDVAAAYPRDAAAVDSGFWAYIEFDRTSARSLVVAIDADLADGRTIRLFTRRLFRSDRKPSPLVSALQTAFAHPRALSSPRAWVSAWRLLKRSLAAGPPPSSAAADATLADRLPRAVLANFLASRARLAFRPPASPTVSVVIVVWNRAELTLACLRALAAQTDAGFETIVVDNASADETAILFDRIDGITVIRNDENRGFVVGANLGAEKARGEYLLFLNNDAELLPGAIAALVETTARLRARAVGAVGGKLISPDGRLQEAGSIVWGDGSCEAYGRGGNPLAPEFDFERAVDFCSGALLLTPRALFAELEGFDLRFKPAYYEDVDYCVRLWMRGHAVIYQPRAVAVHREFGSAVSREASIALQRDHRHAFVSMHPAWLRRQRSRDDGLLAARSHPHGSRSVVLVDDSAPDPRLGAGFPRAAAIIRAFKDLGYRVTVYETAATGQTRSELLADVEVIPGAPAGLRSFFAARRGADAVVVSRPHNMQYMKAAIGADLATLGACLYDAEAIFARRDIGRRGLAGGSVNDAEQRSMIEAETALARGCAAVLVVSAEEKQIFEAAIAAPVFTVSHAVEVAATETAFEHRQSILFVGAFSPLSPNEDAVRMFAHDVLPRLRARRCAAPFVVAGARAAGCVEIARQSDVVTCSDVQDLTPLYEDARVFVAPMRFGAGIPLKVIEAAARGVPVVATTLVARQLGWEPGLELLTADAPDEFAAAVCALSANRELWTSVRAAALARIGRDHTQAVLQSALVEALRAAGSDVAPRASS